MGCCCPKKNDKNAPLMGSNDAQYGSNSNHSKNTKTVIIKNPEDKRVQSLISNQGDTIEDPVSENKTNNETTYQTQSNGNTNADETKPQPNNTQNDGTESMLSNPAD
mmetsp:Transcript_35622/g.44004  ORF Transcript_35622/g.44004 Transcript_35622/m.44004 type:complete len:107 (+) Transcript_35622:373-693(+)